MRQFQTIHAAQLRRHVHVAPYAAIVVSGSYEEAGDFGRFRVHPGDVILHDAFEAHLDRVAATGASVLNVGLPLSLPYRPGVGRVADLDLIVRLARRDETQAAALVVSSTKWLDRICFDWPDELAFALLLDPSLSLSEWSEANGLRPWQVSREFRRIFGISPVAFRARTRARLAWNAIRATPQPFADIAASLGFSDQAHMTRSVKGMTGQPPGHWRGCK